MPVKNDPVWYRTQKGKMAMTSTRPSFTPQNSEVPHNDANGSTPPPATRPVGADGAPGADARHLEPRHHRHGAQGSRSTAQRQVLLIEDDEVAGETLCSGLQ